MPGEGIVVLYLLISKCFFKMMLSRAVALKDDFQLLEIFMSVVSRKKNT